MMGKLSDLSLAETDILLKEGVHGSKIANKVDVRVC